MIRFHARARKAQSAGTYVVIRIDIIAWIDDAQPGVVAARLLDAWGYEHTLIDKLPIFTAANLDQHSTYPQPGWLACELIEQRNVEGRAISMIDTNHGRLNQPLARPALRCSASTSWKRKPDVLLTHGSRNNDHYGKRSAQH